MEKKELTGVLRFTEANAGGVLVKYPRIVLENEGEAFEHGQALVHWLWFYVDKRIKLTLEVLG